MMKAIQQLTTTLSDFFSWWKETLKSLIPSQLYNFFDDQAEQLLLIRFTNFQVHFYSYYRNDEIHLTHFYLHQEDKKRCDIFFEKNKQWANAKKYLLLNDKQVLSKNLMLPLAAQKNLTQVILYEVNRHTPFDGDTLFFTTKIIKSDTQNKQISVDFTFISKNRLMYYYNELKDWGLIVEGVFEDLKTKDYVDSENLLPEMWRTKQSKINKIANYSLLACLGILSLITISYPLWLQQERIKILKQEVVIMKRKANEVDTIKTEINNQIQELNKISEIKQSTPPVLNIINQLTTLLPQKTYLKSFEYSNNRIQILGLSSSASTLIGILENSPYFTQTNFSSPITQDVESGGQDLFQLTTQVTKPKHVQ